MITVIGYDGSELSPAARARLEAAVLVTGPERILRRVRPAAVSAGRGGRAAVDAPPGGPDPLTVIDAHLAADGGPAVVLADGDPGFFGVVRALRERGVACEVLPAASLVSRAFGRVGIPWEDALVVATGDRRRAANVCRAHHKVAVVVRPGVGPGELARDLAPTTPRSLVVFENMGGPGERVVHSRMGEATTRPWRNPDVVLVTDPRHRPGQTPWLAGARPGPGRWALDFSPRPGAEGTGAGAGPEVRACVLARLGPRLGDMVWDVGAGHGEIAVECARFGAAVVAVERDAGRCETIKRNVITHGVKVALTRGQAPPALEPLPDPDAVHVACADPGVLAACAARSPAVVVCTLRAAEAVPGVLAVLRGHGYRAEATRIRADRLTLGADGAARPGAAAPAFVVHATRP